MAKKKSTKSKTPRQSRKGTKQDKKIAFLRQYNRNKGVEFLSDPNITSVGTGYKIANGKETKEICVQFTVGTKSAPETLVAMATTPIPKMVQYGSEMIPTDVVERTFHPEFEVVGIEETDDRKLRVDPVLPGVSIGHINGRSGTFGLVVYDNETGRPCILSNWHVLDRGGDIGDSVVQPGPSDDNNVSDNIVGQLLRSHLGAAGDCAIATIEDREFASEVLELGVAPTKIARVELDDVLVKSGRTTGVTMGMVRRVDVITSIDYGGTTGVRDIGGFEIGPVTGADPTAEISLGGDSGASWMIANRGGGSSDVLAGLHFAGESSTNTDEHAIACYPRSVFKKLDISLEPPEAEENVALEDGIVRSGFDTGFLTEEVPFPELTTGQKRDSFKLNRSANVPYTHFSVNLSKSRRLARYVAWNIDGDNIHRISRRGIRFRFDSRIDDEFQSGEDLYRNNPLDRGHIARRVDLCWGTRSEAERANRDSFFFTNIAPQHESFNQSGRGGLWGRLENSILDEVTVEKLRISVLGGPIFGSNDPEHRGFKIPREFWKLIAYRDMEDGEFKVRAYVLSQSRLLTNLETLELDPFRVHQVSIGSLEQETSLDFGRLAQFDTFSSDRDSEVVRSEDTQSSRREILSVKDLML